MKRLHIFPVVLVLVLSLTACGASDTDAMTASDTTTPSTVQATETVAQSTDNQETQVVQVASTSVSGALLDGSALFSNRDLRQTADLSEAEYYTLTDNMQITIHDEGVFVFTGIAQNASIIVAAEKTDKVQIVLDGVNLTNDSSPCIYVQSADKVFVTTTDTSNSLTVTGSFTADGDTNTDAVIFSKDDLVLQGTGTLTITSTENGIAGKDDLKITGGTITIEAQDTGIEAHDSIAIAGGQISVTARNDGLHAEDNDDSSVGYVYIGGGSLDLQVGDDGIHATTIAQIDDGDISISGSEGIEATVIQINGGNIQIAASDDGINGARKSASYSPKIEISGGYVTITMGSGDTDGIDVNGDLVISGGTVDITGQSPFDYDGSASHTGGTIIVNGSETDEITNQFGGGFGGHGGGQGGFGGRGF